MPPPRLPLCRWGPLVLVAGHLGLWGQEGGCRGYLGPRRAPQPVACHGMYSGAAVSPKLKRPIAAFGQLARHQDRNGHRFALVRAGAGIKIGRKSQVLPTCRDGRLSFGRRRQCPSWRPRATLRLDPGTAPARSTEDSEEGDQTILKTNATTEFLPSSQFHPPEAQNVRPSSPIQEHLTQE